MRGKLARVDIELVRELSKSMSQREVAADPRVACHPAYVRQLLSGRIRRKEERGKYAVLTRLEISQKPRVLAPLVLPPKHRAMRTMTTHFPTRTRAPEPGVLKSGYHSPKIGKRIVKGRWSGLPVYMLTLEERATCPAECALLASCYGNNMPFALRYRHGPALEEALNADLVRLSRKHRRTGFAVRLHILGDFYSVDYVRRWRAWMKLHEGLHVFGFTARQNDPIAVELAVNARQFPERWSLRWSGYAGAMGAVTVPDAASAPSGAIVCPQELGKIPCCAACALCWQSSRTIAFIHH